MITQFRQKILDSMRWVDQQPVRQRLLLLVAVVAVFLTLWDAVLMRSSKMREVRK